jgi:hypothetical protein
MILFTGVWLCFRIAASSNPPFNTLRVLHVQGENKLSCVTSLVTLWCSDEDHSEESTKTILGKTWK